MRTLAVIPARAGSKGIRHKNIRLIAGNPLIYYSISNAVNSGCFDDIVITTDDLDIISYVQYCFPNVSIRNRSQELAGDSITLDPVIYDACIYMEEQKSCKYDVVATLQPTSPTLKVSSLKDAMTLFSANNCPDTVISVMDATHLEWLEEQGSFHPAYTERKNRQWLPKKYRETGAFLITRREFVSSSNRIGKNTSVFPLSQSEAIDIDSPMDWLQAQTILERKKYLIVVSGNKKIGTGHIYRMLTFADELIGNEILFLLINSDENTKTFVRSEGWNFIECNYENVFDEIDKYSPDIVVNDILDTSASYVREIVDRGYYVINFEDLDEGAKYAHLVINALYEYSSPPENHLVGNKYVCLNRNFLIQPIPDFKEQPETMLVTFGGADPNNITGQVLDCISEIFNNTSIKKAIIVLGPAYAHKELFYKKFNSMASEIKNKIQVLENVKNMAALMSQCDIGVTSNGRTIYELASLGIPAISIAQNDRETLHFFARLNYGISYLGIACNNSSENIKDELIAILTDKERRKKMRQSLLDAGIRNGFERVLKEISKRYWNWYAEKKEKSGSAVKVPSYIV